MISTELICKALCLLGVVYLFDVTFPEYVAGFRAKRISRKTKKPILNVGSGTKTSSFTGPKYRGHINCDIAAPKHAACDFNTVCHCDAQDLSKFRDKEFCVALAANVLQYVPNQQKALDELHRVADHVITTDNLLPWPQLGPGHRIRKHILPVPCNFKKFKFRKLR
jgi:SAM-dependent methyltransferase